MLKETIIDAKKYIAKEKLMKKINISKDKVDLKKSRKPEEKIKKPQNKNKHSVLLKKMSKEILENVKKLREVTGVGFMIVK